MNLNHYLSERHIEAGLSLSDSEDFVYLKHGEDVIIKFGKNVTMKEIHDQANMFLSGVQFGQVSPIEDTQIRKQLDDLIAMKESSRFYRR